MKSNLSRKLFLPFIVTSSLALGSLGFASNAYAEYYVVYPGPDMVYTSSPTYLGGDCRYNRCGRSCRYVSRCGYDRCSSPPTCYRVFPVPTPGPVQYIYSSSPRRYMEYRSSSEVEGYAWIPYSP